MATPPQSNQWQCMNPECQAVSTWFGQEVLVCPSCNSPRRPTDQQPSLQPHPHSQGGQQPPYILPGPGYVLGPYGGAPTYYMTNHLNSPLMMPHQYLCPPQQAQFLNQQQPHPGQHGVHPVENPPAIKQSNAAAMIHIRQEHIRYFQCCNSACKQALVGGSKFCSQCGTPQTLTSASDKLPKLNTVDDDNHMHTLEPYKSTECYFCGIVNSLESTDSAGGAVCAKCRRPQPKHEPQGPPCTHGCGVNLLKPDATSCARCGRPQHCTPVKLSTEHQHSLATPSVPPFSPGYYSGYGYPNDFPSQSLPPGHMILASPTPASHAQYLNNPNQITAMNVQMATPQPQESTLGYSHSSLSSIQSPNIVMPQILYSSAVTPTTMIHTGDTISATDETTSSCIPALNQPSPSVQGHPFSARPTKDNEEAVKELDDASKIPIQAETIGTLPSQLQLTQDHPLLTPEDSQPNARKRKKPRDVDDEPEANKQKKVEKGGNDNSGASKDEKSLSSCDSSDVITGQPTRTVDEVLTTESKTTGDSVVSATTATTSAPTLSVAKYGSEHGDASVGHGADSATNDITTFTSTIASIATTTNATTVITAIQAPSIPTNIPVTDCVVSEAPMDVISTTTAVFPMSTQTMNVSSIPVCSSSSETCIAVSTISKTLTTTTSTTATVSSVATPISKTPQIPSGSPPPPTYADATKKRTRSQEQAEIGEKKKGGMGTEPRNVDGLNAPQTKSTRLIFHVLVPKSFWDWNETSTVHIRFGHPRLGEWSVDCGKFQDLADADISELDGVSHMTCTFENFDSDILKLPLPYKYVIQSPKEKMKKLEDCYEYLHTFTGTFTSEYNRCLVIPVENRKFPGGEHHKYDSIVYPKSTKISKSSWNFKGVLLTVVSLGQYGKGKDKDKKEPPDSFKPLDHLAMSTFCLHHYLLKYKKMLNSGCFPEGVSILEIARGILSTYSVLCTECISPIGSANSSSRVCVEWKSVHESAFKEKLRLWFESIVTTLVDNQTINPTKRLLSATCISCCIYVDMDSRTKLLNLLMTNNPENLLLPLLGMLSLHPDKNGDIDTEYKQICLYIPPDQWSKVAAAIATLCKQIAGKNIKSFAVEWMLALPLYHRLIGQASKQDLNLRIDWSHYNTKLGLLELSEKAGKEKQFVVSYYECVKDFFQGDPILPKLFATLAPKQEFQALCDRIPACLCVELLLRRAKTSIKMEDYESWKKDIDRLKYACTIVLPQYSSADYISAMVASSLRLCSKIMEKLRSSEEKQVTLVGAGFACSLCAIESARSLYDDEAGKAEKKKILDSIMELLKEWITDGQVIGGSVFGLSVQTYGTRSHNWKGRQELKVWQGLLSLEVPSEHHSLKDWHKIIEEIVKQRIYEVSSEKSKIELVTEMEKMDKIHPVLEAIVMDAALKAVDALLTNPEKYKMQEIDVETLAKQESERVGKILGKIFDKRYANLTCEPTLDELFDWNHWPRFISICEHQPKLKQGLSNECIQACESAKKTILSLCERFKIGEVSVIEIETSAKNADQILKLFEASYGTDENKNVVVSTALQSVVKQRKEEYKRFKKCHTQLQYLCRYIPIQVEGLGNLQQELGKDCDEININKLCRRDPETKDVQVIYFQQAGTLCEFVTDFQILHKNHGSELFATAWRNVMSQKIRSHPGLKLDDIYEIVWQPCLMHCIKLFESLADLSIRLSEVDKQFKNHQSNLKTQLQALFTGICKCSAEPADWKMIEIAVKRINQYWELCYYREGANIFLRIRDSLGLEKGDFKLVEKISKELATSEGNQTLNDVDESLIVAGVFLEEIANDPKKVLCLQKFASCQDIVKWLQGVTKDVNEIQHFVNVALATAAGGEGDLSHDKLSHLKAVGSGFASLIYNFPKDAGFIELKEACAYIWEALNKNENLPNLLEECNKDIEWYQSVKETQGTVEVTSYGQMRNILKYGRCQIGTMVNSKPVNGIHDLIFLKLIPKDKKLSRTSYNLDELRDLESKLVLITGSKAENRTEVDHYLDILQYITRIAEVLLALRQAGNVAYSGRVVTFNCAVYSTIDKESHSKQEPQLEGELAKEHIANLHATVKELENALEEWEKEVKKSRYCYYELNYYTTLQLLRLRKELGSIRQNSDRLSDPEVLALLQNISSGVTPANVHNVMIDLQKQKVDLRDAANLISETADQDDLEIHLTNNELHVSSPSNLSDGTLDAYGSQPGPKRSSPDGHSIIRPQLTEQDLSDTQKEILTNLVEFCKYSKLLVLKAMEECEEKENTYEIQLWCTEHYCDDRNDIDKFDEKCEESAASSDESSESDEEERHESIFGQQTPLGSSPSNISSKTPLNLTPKVKVVHRPIINESHPIVQQLVEEYEYDIEAAIDAVRMGGGTLERAMDYLADENEDESFEPVSVRAEIEDESENIIIYDDCEAEDKYLSLDELGTVLRMLSKLLPEIMMSKRTFPDEFKPSSPNLIVVPPDDVLRTVLTLYMDDEDLPLPSSEEVLICNTTTTAEEVTLLLLRAVHDPGFKRIFCLVNAEKLSYQICDKVVETMKKLVQGKQDYRLVIVCSKEGEDKSHIVSKLLLYKRSVILRHNDKKYKKYLRTHFIDDGSIQAIPCKASIVDRENSCVRVVFSKRTGMGKSLFVYRMAEQLGIVTNSCAEAVQVTIPIHGPSVTSDVLLCFLKEHYKDDNCKIYHFDVSPSVLSDVDTILFSLLILRGLTDSQGRVWRCHPSQLYVVEVTLPRRNNEDSIFPDARTVDLLNLLPSVECLSPTETKDAVSPGLSEVGMDDKEFCGSTIQRVYQYLKRYAEGVNLDFFKFQGNTEGVPNDCLKLFLQNCGVQDPSWSEIHHFAKFLDLQLESCEKSVFCDETFVGDVMSGLKGFVVKFMIRMSRDFATPSLRGEVTRENQLEMFVQDVGSLDQYEIEHRRRWEESSHPYIFFNNDRISITFVGFIITKTGDLVDPRRVQLESHIMTPQLYTGLILQGVDFSDNYQNWKKTTMIEKLSLVMGISSTHDPDDTYVLTVDNLIKILAIQMRFRCGIPVVIMGETGCGKTRLIRYMCDLTREGREARNMLILKIHGGTTEENIVQFISIAEKEAKKNKANKMDTVVFFDEANTTDAIGLIKEIMCDRRIHGNPVSEDLKFIAACNPYRKHSDEMIKTLETAGLGFYVRATETQQRLGKIPLRQLVYRVLDLPPSMRPLVYDFGQLKKGTEDDYIRQIVRDHVNKHPGLSNENARITSVITGVLAASQAYMRSRDDECSFVSLRDVERAMIVFEYFYEKIVDFRQAAQKQAMPQLNETLEEEHPDNITMALILAVSVCYHARLQKRTEYEEKISAKFMSPLVLPGGAAQFRNEITWCQNVLLDNMELGKNIAKNAALRENVFMMAICVELRIPLFLVGKPGSSKSLAKSIIQNSMHGETSRSDLLKKFKQVHMFSYQCSQLATSESVIEVFKSAKKFQLTQDTTRYVSVVVLDEVGLAEDSPNLPLKALHPLLEDGTEGAGAEGRDEVINRDLRVAFIGISNWALDPAKMNRGVMVTRGVPDVKELKFSAEGICGDEVDDSAKAKLEPYFDHFAEAYEAICKKQDKEFFGLRDFYSLIKMLYWMCKESVGVPLTWQQMKHGIMRNFGGLRSEEWDPFEEFRKRLNLPEEDLNQEDYDEKTWRLISPDCTRLGLIKTSLATKETSFHGENRYLLFLTENYAALDILEHYIRGKKNEKIEFTASMESEDAVTNTQALKPFTLFGSSFPKDKEYTQVCRNINQIKICMETGRTVILLNLENLYESLYDVLNQYYMHYGDNRYVDLGLQSHRVKCRVHKDFKLILIAERETVYKKFPTPLINRLEKHFVLTSSVLKDWQKDILDLFQDWIKEFSGVRGASGLGEGFKEGHAFIGFQKDTPAAVVFQASRQLKRLKKEPHWRLESLQRNSIFGDISLKEVVTKEKGSELWKRAILLLSQYLLLQIAPDDALVRLKRTALADQQKEFLQLYFAEQHHKSIVDFVCHHVGSNDVTQEGLLMQVTTHGHLLSRDELENMGETINMMVEAFLLQEFDTELDFSNRVGTLFQRENEDYHSCLIVVQCDSGHMNGDLIACARYRIYDERVKALEKNKIQNRHNVTQCHVLFIINLPYQVSSKSSFVGFQGDPWISAHIDDLKPMSGNEIEPLQAISATISELFIGDYINDIKPFLDETYQHPQRCESQTESDESSRVEEQWLDEEKERNMNDSNGRENDKSKVFAINAWEEVEQSQAQVLASAEIPVDSIPHQFHDLTVSTHAVEESQAYLQGELVEHDHLPDSEEETEVVGSKKVEDARLLVTVKSEDSTNLSLVMLQDSESDTTKQNNLILPSSPSFKSPVQDHEVSSEIPKPKLMPCVGRHPTAQCRRLYYCIQAAASKLEDATKDRSTQRVTRLTKLIPRNPAHYIGKYFTILYTTNKCAFLYMKLIFTDQHSFYGILVIHLYKLLQERETVRPDLSEWVLSEALNASKLEVGGTFRNVLARKIDDVVIPIFAKIIACIDCNYNLDRIDPKAQDSSLSQFWLAIFREPKIMKLKYAELVQGDKVPGVGGAKSNQVFKGQMPFFWLIKATVDSQWDSAKSTAEANREHSYHSQFCNFILSTPVGAVLDSFNESSEELYTFYLHDFVMSIHKCKHDSIKHDDMEYQLVSDALNHLVHSSEFKHRSLISRIAALHLVYWTNRSQILWFGQLASHSPSIMESMLGVLPPKEFPEMELHLHAAMKVMAGLEPPLKKDNPNPNLTVWLNSIRRSQNAIMSILNLKSSSEMIIKARHCWYRLRATQLFVEHVMLKHPTVDLKLAARRLTGLWKGSADFLKAVTVKSVQLQLSSMERFLKDECNDKHKIKEIKKSCREFFMELVSDLCFGGKAPPEPSLVKMLLDKVFVEKNDSTQELTPYKDDKADKIPTIRSFLLQLLLEHSMDQIRDHLKDYLHRSYHVVSEKQADVDQNLYLLIIQCFEDSLAKKFSSQCLMDKAHEAVSLLIEGHYALVDHHGGTPTLEYLEGVAKLRYSLLVVAEVLKNEEQGQYFAELLKATEKLCANHEINCIDLTGQKDTTGPAIYLLKLVVRIYGMPCLKAAAEMHEWIIPLELKSDEDKIMDPFIVYGDTYKKIRETVSDAVYGSQIEELSESMQNLQPQEVIYFLLALYEKVTLSRGSTNVAKRISGDAIDTLNEFVVNYQLLSNELCFTARALLANQQGGRVLEQMTVSPQQPLQCKTILGVVIHSVAVFFGKKSLDVLLPFINILNNPAALNNSYLPTMPEDQLFATQAAMMAMDANGQFYECPRGHRYFVGDCGGVVTLGVCNVCRAPIGGTNYNLEQGNTSANLQDTTKTGHDLEGPQDRTDISPERDLSSRTVCILRALMHSAFVWASCNNDRALGAIAGLINHPVPPQQLPEFFWAHLEKDLELLGKDTGKGLDENVMILHLVLRQILTTKPPIDGTIQTVSTLETKVDRQTWERIFNQHYIQPVLNSLDQNLAISMDMVAKDDQQDHDQLFYLIYENMKYTEEKLEPHLWTYRSRITVEHLRQTLCDKKLQNKYPILDTFLQNEAELRATQYIPLITRLQQCLYDRFNRQIDKQESKRQTIQEFIKNLPDESVKNNYRDMIGGFVEAWTLVGHKLKHHGRLPVADKYYIAVINDDTPIEYLIPTTSEAGVCTTSLVDFLTLTHNSFIERCRALVAENDKISEFFWREHKVPITHLHRCHLVDYEHQLPSIILSHCHYSLRVGKGQDIKYDYQALEKHILNRFIHGKPLILLDIPQVVYRKDIYTTITFADVRKKVEPQEILPQRVRQDITAELCTPVDLREALDVIEIVLGFLSSGGGKADKLLGEYIDKTLKMKRRRFSQKAKDSCQLKHVLSLWETISVELARQLCLRGQEPFDSIRQKFLRHLSDSEDGENQFEALDSCLGQFDSDLLLGTLYEFIETYVKHCPQHEYDQPLVGTLKLVLEQYGAEPLPQLAEFPASIKLDQAVAAWKHIVQYYAKRH